MSIPSSNTSRRHFVIHSLAACGMLGAASVAQAQAMLAETDPQAVALGYKADASKVDKAKQPKFVAGQNCANCALYQAAAGAAAGGCPLFAGKQVAGKGWCAAWAKKA